MQTSPKAPRSPHPPTPKFQALALPPATCRLAVALLAVTLATTPIGASAQARHSIDPQLFPVPASLQPNVDFWVKVYSGYDSNHVLLHDDRYLQVIYEVVDFTAVNSSEASSYRKSRARRDELDAARKRYRTLLGHLAAGRRPQAEAAELARIETLFADVPGDRSKYSAAANRIRSQTCLKDRFEQAVIDSGRYMPMIQEIFRARGLPETLTRMPFVESMFQLRAHSSAAAVGMWQFVRPTARLFLSMEIEYDERYDPQRASEAAADLLKKNYQQLGTWPLAVTAYNHGPNGMRRAVNRLGTKDLGVIAERYRSRTFGFASRNFYAEVIAAATVYDGRADHFPDANPEPAWQYDEVVPDLYVSMPELAKQANLDLDTLRQLNPAFTSQIWSGSLFAPKGYRLRVPSGRGESTRAAYAALPENAKASRQVGLYYQVQGGDTLSKIAARYGTSVSAIQRANNLRSAHLIRRGQRLLIPPRSGATIRSSTAPARHTVRRGETLSSIARRYGTTVTALRAANRVRGDVIVPNQVLVIP